MSRDDRGTVAGRTRGTTAEEQTQPTTAQLRAAAKPGRNDERSRNGSMALQGVLFPAWMPPA